MSWNDYKHAIVYVHISGTCLTFLTVCVLRRRKNETKSFFYHPLHRFFHWFSTKAREVGGFFPFLSQEWKMSHPLEWNIFPLWRMEKNALGNGKLVPVTRMFLSSLKTGTFHQHPRNPVIFLTVYCTQQVPVH